MYPVMETSDRLETPHQPDSAVVVAQQTIMETEEILLKTEIKQPNEVAPAPVPMYEVSPYRNSEVGVNPLMAEEYTLATSFWDLPRRMIMYRLLALLVVFIPIYNMTAFTFNILAVEDIFKAINRALELEGMDDIPFPRTAELFQLKIHEPIIGIMMGMILPCIGFKALKKGGSTRWLGCFNCCTCCSFFCSILNFIVIVVLLGMWSRWSDLTPECDAQSMCYTPLNKSDQEIMQCIDGTSPAMTLPEQCEPIQPFFIDCEHEHHDHWHHGWHDKHHGHFTQHHWHRMGRVIRMVTAPHHPVHYDFANDDHAHFHQLMLPQTTTTTPFPSDDWMKLDDEVEIELAEREDRDKVFFHQLPTVDRPSAFEVEPEQKEMEPKIMFLMTKETRPVNFEVNFTKIPFGPGPADGPMPPPPEMPEMEEMPEMKGEEEGFEHMEDRMLAPRPEPPHHVKLRMPLHRGHRFLPPRPQYPPPPPPPRPHFEPHLPPSRDPKCKLNKKGMRNFHVYLSAQPEISYYLNAILLLGGTCYFIYSILYGCLFHHGRRVRAALIADERCARELQDFSDADAEDEDNPQVVVASTGDGYGEGMYPMMENVNETHAARVVPLLQGQTAVV